MAALRKCKGHKVGPLSSLSDKMNVDSMYVRYFLEEDGDSVVGRRAVFAIVLCQPSSHPGAFPSIVYVVEMDRCRSSSNAI